MRTLIAFLFTVLLATAATYGQTADEGWQEKLKNELQTLDTAKSITTWEHSIDTLEALAKANPDEWLLQYYTGWACTQSSFQAPKGGAEPLCDRAEPYVKKALTMQPAHTETLTLMAYWLSARINATPAKGASLGPDSRNYSDKAIAADSSNPRAYLMKALVIFHTPSLFGGGKKKAQPVVLTTAEKFAAFKPRNALDPHWGNNIFQQLAAEYK